MTDAERAQCDNCEGCGKVANDEEGSPWTRWLALPLGSSAAVLMGLVKPIPCPTCGGTGQVDDADKA